MTVYIAIGIPASGIKEVLGLWMHTSESASFWMNVFTDLKIRGVEDIIFLISDNLTRLTKC